MCMGGLHSKSARLKSALCGPAVPMNGLLSSGTHRLVIYGLYIAMVFRWRVDPSNHDKVGVHLVSVEKECAAACGLQAELSVFLRQVIIPLGGPCVPHPRRGECIRCDLILSAETPKVTEFISFSGRIRKTVYSLVRGFVV